MKLNKPPISKGGWLMAKTLQVTRLSDPTQRADAERALNIINNKLKEYEN